MRITVLGLGQMGRALAGRLVGQGHEVTVWNRSPGRAAELVARGAREADDPVAAIADAEVVMSILAADAAVTAVLLPGGAPLLLGGEAVLVECSTVAPTTSRRLAGAYPGRMVAAPVLGGPAALERGEAALVVAGPAALIDRLGPLWASVCAGIRRAGEDPGSALVVKLLNNYLLMGGIAMLAEAVAVGQAAGLSDGLLGDLLGSAPMVATGVRNRLEDLISGDHEGWFSPAMGAKDVHLWVDVATDHAVDLPLARLLADRYDEVAASDVGQGDITAVIELVRRSVS